MFSTFEIITNIVVKVLSLFLPFLKTNKKTILDEDKQLAEAIKKGDTKMVAKIRERRKNYKLGIVLLASLMLVGCVKHTYKDVPLTQSGIAYRLPPGQYTDTENIIHNESNVRWSLSEEDLYNNTRQIKSNIGFLSTLKPYFDPIMYSVLFILVAITAIKMKRHMCNVIDSVKPKKKKK